MSIGIDTAARYAHKIDQKLELDNLPIADGAEYDSYSNQHEDECLPGTRQQLRRQILEWSSLPKGKCIFWLNGLAGTGKSTISRTIARSFQKMGILGASFFFRRSEGDRGNATRFFSTITRQLFTKIPELLPVVKRALQNDPRISAKPLRDQFKTLVLHPLLELENRTPQAPTLVIVIDALDECEGDNHIRTILQLLPQVQMCRSVRLRIFVTSRPELPIRLGFRDVGSHHQDLILHEIPNPIIEHDISLFLEHKFTMIRSERSLSADWPGKTNFQALLTMSVPLFIVAATMCRLFEDHNLDPEQCLTEILENQNQESQLDGTYLPVFSRLLASYEEERRDKLANEVQELLSIIVLLEAPLSAVALAKLMNIELSSVKARLNPLHSVLSIPNDETIPVRIFHLSFREFLLHPRTRKRSPIWVDKKQTHRRLTNYCLDIMCKKLKKNICNLKSYGTERRDIDTYSVGHYLPPELQYSCRYWTYHLAQSKDPETQADTILAFLEVHFLHWAEVMSILGIISDIVDCINTLQSTLQVSQKYHLMICC